MKKIMIPQIVASFLTLLIVVTVPAQTVLTIEDAIDAALEHNPKIKEIGHEIRVKYGDIKSAETIENPLVEAEIEDITGDGYLTMNIGISQPVNLIPIRGLNRQAATIEREILEQNLKGLKREISLETTQAFLRVCAAQKNLETANEFLTVAASIDSLINARIEAGKSSPIEASRSVIELSYSELQKKEQERIFQEKKLKLAGIWNSTKVDFQRVTAELDLPTTLPDLAELHEKLENNSDIRALRKGEELATIRRRIAAISAIPGIEIGAGISHSQNEDETSFRAGIGIPIPLFDRNQGAKIAKEAELDLVKQQLSSMEKSLQIKLENLLNKLQSLQNHAFVLEKEIVPSAETALEILLKGYESGRYSYLDVIEARNTLIELREDLLETKIDFFLAQAEIEEIIGQKI